jgi:hypothetical protein
MLENVEDHHGEEIVSSLCSCHQKSQYLVYYL